MNGDEPEIPERSPAVNISEAHEWKPRNSPWLISLSILLATFMEVLDTSIANVSLPHIAGSMSATPEESTWVLTSYLVSNAIILPAAGWLSRYFGRKKYLFYSVILFTVSSAFCGLAHSLQFLIIARIFQGLGGGGLQPVAQAILLESFPHEKRGSAMAAYGMGIVVAPIIGPTLGGWITDTYSWRWIFYINIPIGILGLIMQQIYLEDPPYMKKIAGLKIDGIGFGLMALWIGILQIVLDKGQQMDWFESKWIVCGFIAVAVFFVAFFFWELAQEHPIVNLRVLKNRNFAMGTLLVLMLGAVLYSSTAVLPIFMQVLLHYTAYISGLAMTPRGIGSFFSMLMMGYLVRKIDNRYLIVVGFGGIAATCWFLSHLSLEITPANVSWPLFLNGLTMAFIFVPMTTLSVATLRQNEIYQATGIYSLMRNIGGGIGISSVITYQSRMTQVHQSILVSHLSPYDPVFQMQIQKVTRAFHAYVVPNQAGAMANGAIYRSMLEQASLLSFMDCFRWLGIICLLCIPLAFLFNKIKMRKKELIID